MRIDNLNEMFRCEHSCCKNFASKEILIGGYKKGISLCSDHYIQLVGLIKEDARKAKAEGMARAKVKVQVENEG